MANRPVADNRFAFDDLRYDGDFVFGEEDAHAFADRRGIATDGNKVSVAARADRNVTSKTQNAFCA